jgi:uncharacterized protein YndB with AHSA1/START domain
LTCSHNEIGERWITRYEESRVRALADLKRALEGDRAMEKPSFIYTTYIKTTPERLWEALTEPAFTKRYWGATFESNWNAGSPMTWEQFGLTTADAEQVVLESEPHHRLAFTWHTFTPEFYELLDLTDEARERLLAESRSKVIFDIEPLGELVKLTVVHDGFDAGSLVAPMVTLGWPRILASLKTLLETGETLPDAPEPPPTVRLGLTREAASVASD